MSLDTFAIMIVLCTPGFLSSIYEAQSQTSLVNSTEVLYYSDKVEYICKVEYINQISWSLEASDVVITIAFFPAFHSQGKTQDDTLLSYTITAALTSVSNSSIVSTLTLPIASTLNGVMIACNGMTSIYDYGKIFCAAHGAHSTYFFLLAWLHVILTCHVISINDQPLL